jgi:hypothetical protein
LKTIENKGIFDYNETKNYSTEFDLRNPKNKNVRDEILNAFGLDPNKLYIDNCRLTNTKLTTDFLKRI